MSVLKEFLGGRYQQGDRVAVQDLRYVHLGLANGPRTPGREAGQPGVAPVGHRRLGRLRVYIGTGNQGRGDSSSSHLPLGRFAPRFRAVLPEDAG